MPQKTEYKVISGAGDQPVQSEINQWAAHGFRPIMLSSTAVGDNHTLRITVLLEGPFVEMPELMPEAYMPEA